MYKGATSGEVGGSEPPKFGRTTPTFYVAADCTARNWVYHPYFVLYNNLDQGLDHQLRKRGCANEAVWERRSPGRVVGPTGRAGVPRVAP